MRPLLSLLFAFLLINVVNAQEEAQTSYEIALQRIQEAEASGATFLDLGFLGLTELPPEIGNLNNLRILYLFNNQLSSLPPEIGNLSNLEHLYLHSNQLSYLPPEIGNLSNLYRLYLHGNQLSSLPPEIGNLSDLCYLDISENLFQSIPLELHSLKQLGTLEACYVVTGLVLDDYLLDTLPEEVANGRTSAILAYLENQAWWHFQRLIGSISGTIGLVSAAVLAWRWKYRRGKSKRKHEEIKNALG